MDPELPVTDTEADAGIVTDTDAQAGTVVPDDVPSIPTEPTQIHGIMEAAIVIVATRLLTGLAKAKAEKLKPFLPLFACVTATALYIGAVAFQGEPLTVGTLYKGLVLGAVTVLWHDQATGVRKMVKPEPSK